MNKMKYVGLFLGLALTMASATTVYAAELKIGVVNAAKVLDQSPQKASALARLEKEFSGRSKGLESKAKALLARQNKLKNDSATLSAKELQNKERALISSQRDLKRLQDEFSEDLSIRRNEELRKLEERIAKTIIELAKAENYDLMSYQGVIFAKDTVDVTPKVLAKLKSTP